MTDPPNIRNERRDHPVIGPPEASAWYAWRTTATYPAACPSCGRLATYDPNPDPDAADELRRCVTCGQPHLLEHP